MQALLPERIGERPHHVLLPDQFGKSFGPPLAGEDLTHLKMVLQPRLMKIDALIGLFESGVR